MRVTSLETIWEPTAKESALAQSLVKAQGKQWKKVVQHRQELHGILYEVIRNNCSHEYPHYKARGDSEYRYTESFCSHCHSQL